MQKKNVTEQNLALKALLADTVMLSNAAAEGKLSARADASKHEGTYAEIVRGMNAMLDAILVPIGEGNRVLAQISSGKIHELIAQTPTKATHEKMKQRSEQLAVVLGGLVEASAVLSKMANNAYKSGDLRRLSLPRASSGRLRP